MAGGMCRKTSHEAFGSGGDGGRYHVRLGSGYVETAVKIVVGIAIGLVIAAAVAVGWAVWYFANMFR